MLYGNNITILTIYSIILFPYQYKYIVLGPAYILKC